jgi:exonuclease III
MKIISWNIRQGGGSRAEAIAQALIQHQADVIILSEYQNNPAGNLIRIRLMLDGFHFQSPSTADKDKNGVLIATRSVSSFQPVLHADDGFEECVLECHWNQLILCGVYLPHKKKHTRFDFLLNAIKTNTASMIIAGDYNTGFNRIDQAGDSFWYEEKLRLLQKLGMKDAYRMFHQDIKEYSWYSHQGNGFRYDHTWVSDDLSDRVIRCEYSHVEREQNLTDHSMMILELK